MWQSLFIVWRESVEALLVIGILFAWLNRQPNSSHAKKMLWLGTGLGILFACTLAIGFTLAGEWLSGSGGEWFQAAMIFVASLLILQMVIWMHRNGRFMKSHLEREASTRMAKGGLGILFLAMLAVAREGSETVIFLYGIGAQQTGTSLMDFTLGGIFGFILALMTFGILQLFSHIISWRIFFAISEVILLLLGGALLMSALDKAGEQLMNLDIPEWLYTWFDPAWDTSNLIPNSIAPTLASFTGYRAQPSWLGVILLPLYWLVALIFIKYSGHSKN